MSTFAFRAVDLAGTPARGELEADSKAHVNEQLRQRGLIVIDITEEHESIKLEQILDRVKRVSGRDLAVMTRQLATMVDSGMPILRALYTLEEQTESEILKNAISAVRADVEAGQSLAVALDRHPRVFSKLYVAMVAAGEESGQLETALDRVAFQLEKLDALKRQVRSAMIYPAVVAFVAIGVMMALVAFVVPIFVDTFIELAKERDDISDDLPALTQAVVTTSDAFTGYWWAIIPGVIAAGFFFERWRRTPKGQRVWQRFTLRLPMKIGDVVQKVALARWSRTFSGLTAAGVPLLQAIEVTGKTSGNTVIEDAMGEVYTSVRNGGSISQPLAEQDIFPSMVSHMVGVGEESGSLDHMLEKIADFYEVEVDAKIKALTSIIEPAMILFIGAAVGIIVIAMYLPMFSLYDKIG